MVTWGCHPRLGWYAPLVLRGNESPARCQPSLEPWPQTRRDVWMVLKTGGPPAQHHPSLGLAAPGSLIPHTLRAESPNYRREIFAKFSLNLTHFKPEVRSRKRVVLAEGVEAIRVDAKQTYRCPSPNHSDGN